MLLGGDRDSDGGGSAHDEKGTGHSGKAGTHAPWSRGCGSERALRPRHDHTETGYAPPVRVSQCRLLAFPRVFYPRSLKSQ
jgi:hypothetical protein